MQPFGRGEDGDKGLCVIPITYDFDIRKIIIKIINSTSATTSTPILALVHQENIDHFDIEQLVSHLRHKLSGQKFLLVLDDIWNDN
jgi:hypothetical protein